MAEREGEGFQRDMPCQGEQPRARGLSGTASCTSRSSALGLLVLFGPRSGEPSPLYFSYEVSLAPLHLSKIARGNNPLLFSPAVHLSERGRHGPDAGYTPRHSPESLRAGRRSSQANKPTALPLAIFMLGFPWTEKMKVERLLRAAVMLRSARTYLAGGLHTVDLHAPSEPSFRKSRKRRGIAEYIE